MHNALFVISRCLHGLAIALWLGGLVLIGAVVAPTTFHVLAQAPVLATDTSLQKSLAGAIVGSSLRKFNGICYICGVLLFISEGIFLALSKQRIARRCTSVNLAVTAILLGSALYLGFSLFPQIDLAQQRHLSALFDALHARYVNISFAQIPLALLLILIFAIREPFSQAHPQRGL